MHSRRRFTVAPSIEILPTRIVPSADISVAVPGLAPPLDVSFALGDPGDSLDPSSSDPSNDGSFSPADFDWAPFCAVEDFPPLTCA